MTRQFKFWATALLLLLTMQSCSYIDDDRSDCENTYSLTYQLEVVSNINMQLSEQLKVDAGSMTLKTLDKYFQSVLQPTTTEARLGFYPIGGNPIFFNRDIEGQRTAFSIAIPANNYRHIAVIGQSDPPIFLTDSAKASTVRLTQFLRDTVDSHVQAVMAGTLDMNVLGNQNQSWQVDLYPADAGVAVVMKRNAKVQRLRVFLADLATSFTPDDSTWHWDHASLVRTVPADVSGTDSTAYCGVALPSHAATTAAKALVPAATVLTTTPYGMSSSSPICPTVPSHAPSSRSPMPSAPVTYASSAYVSTTTVASPPPTAMSAPASPLTGKRAVSIIRNCRSGLSDKGETLRS